MGDIEEGARGRVLHDGLRGRALLEAVRALAPEAFASGELDLPRLALLLALPAPALSPSSQELCSAPAGELLSAPAGETSPLEEPFGLVWPGKGEGRREAFRGPVTVPVPLHADSVGFAAARHVFVEGENLEALRLLAHAYAGKVRAVYLDPPYNTGRDFLYGDRHAEGRAAYLHRSGQADAEGRVLLSQAAAVGRHHSRWLGMMQPRLILARTLLAEDGVLFASIDDHEVHHLRMLLDEIFGEENRVASFVWQARQSIQNDTDLSVNHEYVLAYAKRRGKGRRPLGGEAAPGGGEPLGARGDFVALPLPLREETFANPDGDPRGPWKPAPFDAPGIRANLSYAISCPATGESFRPPPGRCWRTEEASYLRLLAEGRIHFGRSGRARPQLKLYLEEQRARGGVANTWLDGATAGTAAEGTRQLQALFGGRALFDFPKPTALLRALLRLATRGEDLVADLFAGSGTTAQAVLELNAEDGGRRRFLLIQAPEPTPPASAAREAGHATIASLSLERVRRALAAHPGEGVRAFRLHPVPVLHQGDLPSHPLVHPQGDLPSHPLVHPLGDLPSHPLVHPLGDLPSHSLGEGRAPADLALPPGEVAETEPQGEAGALIFSEALAAGLGLDAALERLTLADRAVWALGGRRLLICLAPSVDPSLLREMMALGPSHLACLDAAFGGNDALKAAMVLEAEARGIRLRAIPPRHPLGPVVEAPGGSS